MNWEYEPSENLDGGYARNLQSVLKNPWGTWSQSVFSSEHNSFIAPNRDYPHQGLTGMVNGESWKFLDAVFIKALDTSSETPLLPAKVSVSPWKATYNYSSGDTALNASYYLFPSEKGLSAKIDFKASKPLTLLVRPLTDVRPVNAQSGQQETSKGKDFLLTSSEGKSVMAKFEGNASILEEQVKWWYKLGSGFREETGKGIKFKGEARHPVFTGEFSGYGDEFRLLLTCGETAKVEEMMKETERMREAEHSLPRLAVSLGNKKLDHALSARLYCMQTFDLDVHGVSLPAAGDYWFKKAYFRDIFESLYNNMRVLIDLRGKHYIKNILEFALSLQDEHGRIPNTYPPEYSGADSTTLCFAVAGKYLEETKDKKFAAKVLKHLEKTIDRFSKTMPSVDGPPVITEEGLLACVPWHSWTDARVSFQAGKERIDGIPTRVPEAWKKEYYDQGKSVQTETNLPDYLLPEINAQWIKMLEAVPLMSQLSGKKIKYGFVGEIRDAFIDTFWENGFVCNLVRGERKDPTLTSMGLIAAVMLEDALGHSKLKQMRKGVEELLVYRKGKPFGILVKNSGERVYYNDNQYHEAVIWPRDTPYLVKYFLLIGEKRRARELLENQLDHQMSEGAIFYNHELFSLPESKSHSAEPVPVKNPLQYWSQFTEPFYWAFR